MNRIAFLIALPLILLLINTASYATTAKEGSNSFSGSLSGIAVIYSDYSPRGISMSARRPAARGLVSYNLDNGPYAGICATSLKLNDHGAKIETVLYGGFKKQWSGWDIDVGGLEYTYQGVSHNTHYNFFENKLAIGRSLGFANVSGTLFYAPNFFGGTGNTYYKILNASGPIEGKLGWNLSLAHQDIGNNAKMGLPDYWHWSVGPDYDFRGFVLSARYMDSTINKGLCNGNCGPRMVLMATRSF